MAFHNVPPNGFPDIPDIEDLEAVQGDVNTLKTGKAPKTDIAAEFSATANYAVGDLVYKDGVLYECTTAHEAAAWAADDFTAASVGSVATSLMSGLTNVENSITGISKGYYKAYVTAGKWYKIGDISATTWVIHSTLLAFSGEMLKLVTFRYDGSSHTFNNNSTKINNICGSVGYIGMKFGTNSAELYIKGSQTGTTTYTVLSDGNEGTLNVYAPIATTYTDSDIDLIESGS